jgi:hypothetical protein
MKCYREVCRGSGAKLGGGGGGAAALGGKMGSTMNTKIILFPINSKLLRQIKGCPKNNCDIF